LRKSEIHDGGYKNSLTHISAETQDSKKCPTAMLNILQSGNTERPVGILANVWVSWKLKMAIINRK